MTDRATVFDVCQRCWGLRESLQELQEEKRKLEVKIDRLEIENKNLKSDIDDLLRAERETNKPQERPATVAVDATQNYKTAKERILYLIQTCNEIGMISHEIRQATQLAPGTVSARLAELVREGKIVFNGVYRKVPGGKGRNKVWVSK